MERAIQTTSIRRQIPRRRAALALAPTLCLGVAGGALGILGACRGPGSVSAPHHLQCYTHQAGAKPHKVPRCVRKTEGGYRLSRQALDALEFRGRALVSVHVERLGWAWARRDGSVVDALDGEFGPDPFQQDRARVLSGKRMGFIDRQGHVVISPRFEFASMFARDYALVARGGRFTGASRGYEGHRNRGPRRPLYQGGQWGVLHRSGRLVVPMTLTRPQALRKIGALRFPDAAPAQPARKTAPREAAPGKAAPREAAPHKTAPRQSSPRKAAPR